MSAAAACLISASLTATWMGFALRSGYRLMWGERAELANLPFQEAVVAGFLTFVLAVTAGDFP